MGTIDKIILLLEENNRTQKELTDFLCLDKSTFSAWKNGKSQSYNKYLFKIAEFFNVSTDYLLDNDETQDNKPQQQLTGIYFKLGKEAQELGLDEEDIENILNLYRKHKKNNE